MKVYFDAILQFVGDAEPTDKGKKQQIRFACPQYDKFTGSKLREDIYEAVILGENIDKLNATILEGEVVRATCFLNTYDRESDGKTWHNLSLSCVDLSLKKES